MSKKMKKSLVPELRFLEYKSAPNWSSLQLGEVSDRITKKVGDKKLTTVSITAGKGFVSQTEKFSRDISGKQYKNYIILKAGEFSYNKGNSKTFPQGAVYRLKEFEEVAVPNAFISFRFKADYVPDFYKGYFDNNYHGRQILKFITSGARSDGLLNISPDDFFSITLPTPIDRKEQQKIADCLSSLDELIAAHTQKHQALQSYRKGLMQSLFPAEGESVPALRFPEFGAESDWVEEKFGDITNFSSGGTPSKDREDYWGGNIPWISAASMHDIAIDDSERCITKLAVEEGARIATKGTLLLLVRGSMLHKRILLGIAGRDVAFNQDVKALNLKKPIIEEFLLYLLLANELRLLGAVTKTGIGAGKLDTADLKDFRFRIPQNTEEQQKIANFLSFVDDLITAQAQKIDELKEHKKGLMQQLYPSGNEVGV